MIIKAVSWIIYGLVVGAVARLLAPGDQSNSMISAILLGIAGSFVGGFIGNAIFGKDTDGKRSWIFEFALALGGAIILVLINRFFLHW